MLGPTIPQHPNIQAATDQWVQRGPVAVVHGPFKHVIRDQPVAPPKLGCPRRVNSRGCQRVTYSTGKDKHASRLTNKTTVDLLVAQYRVANPRLAT